MVILFLYFLNGNNITQTKLNNFKALLAQSLENLNSEIKQFEKFDTVNMGVNIKSLLGYFSTQWMKAPRYKLNSLSTNRTKRTPGSSATNNSHLRFSFSSMYSCSISYKPELAPAAILKQHQSQDLRGKDLNQTIN